MNSPQLGQGKVSLLTSAVSIGTDGLYQRSAAKVNWLVTFDLSVFSKLLVRAIVDCQGELNQLRIGPPTVGLLPTSPTTCLCRSLNINLTITAVFDESFIPTSRPLNRFWTAPK